MEEFFNRLLLFHNIQLGNENENNLFQKITEKPLKMQIKPYCLINTSTIQISSYFDKSIEKFPSLFEQNLNTFEECLTYLESISIPNKCVCAAGVENIPGWRCVDCSKYENTLYCNDCYTKSKDLHKNHKVYYLSNSRGMCDCGDPDSLYTYCHEHSGPFKEQKQIDDYIEKNFGKKIVDNLKAFFDEFFIEFSKYLILTEKYDMFINDVYAKKFNQGSELNEMLENAKEDIILVKSNFCKVFENFIYFLRLITKKNLGMFHLIAKYFLKNHFISTKLENEYMTNHRCIEQSQNDIKIFYDSDKKENHICKCPFLRLFISNYRDDVKLKKKEEEDEFFYSFARDLSSRYAFCIILFFLYEENLNNFNNIIMVNRNQFYLEDATELIAKKTSLIEESMCYFYKTIFDLIKNENILGRNNMSKKLKNHFVYMAYDARYFSKPKMRLLMTDKTLYFKTIADSVCLIQNIDSYESIYPHPKFQDKQTDFELLNLEIILLNLPYCLCSSLDWKKIEKIKEIYTHIIYKVLNQEKEGIIQLKDNQFTMHMTFYRFLGGFINAFCFNYSFINNCTILESMNYFKNNFFNSKEEIQNFCDIILKDYFKLFGFIGGSKNNFFNYYDSVDIFYKLYFDYFYIGDFTLLKYIFILSEKNIDINSYLKLSNLENVYSTFDNIFNKGIIIKEEPNKEIEEKKTEETSPVPDLSNFFNRQFLTRQEQNFALRRIIYDASKDNYKSGDDYNILMQWEFLLEFLIYIMKNDSCYYYSLIQNYNEIISSKTKMDLYNNIKTNKYVMEDLKNILQEKIIHILISEGNLIDMKSFEKKIDDYLITLFEENDIFNKTWNELTYSKNDEQTKIFYLKDEYLKYIDCNYYVNSKEKSAAQKYIFDFKKDVVKTYNYYYYNQSYLTFEFIEKVYEKVLLDKNNLELILRIIEKLINDDNIMKNLDKKSIRNSLLPIMLNYLSILSVINTKSFIEFKLNNKDIINKLYEILFNFIKNNNKNNIIDNDLEDNIKEILNQINRYQLIYNYYNEDLSKLNKYDFNTNIIEIIKQNEKSNINNINIIEEEIDIINIKKQKLKDKKDKLKLLMKKKANNFMKKIESNEKMLKVIEEEIKQDKNKKNNEDEIMCFYCRNNIKLNSFDEPYGKLGLTINDYFYNKCIISTLREELKDNENIYNRIKENIAYCRYNRLTSCGHYLHLSCFQKGIVEGGFNCSLCLKKQNVFIPPLTQLYDNYYFFKSLKIGELFGENENMSLNQVSEVQVTLFDDIIKTFLNTINIFKNIKSPPYDIKIDNLSDDIYLNYRPLINCLENIFYSEGTTFHKQQQIDNIKNINLSLRFKFYQDNQKEKEKIINFIKTSLFKLAEGPRNEDEYIYKEEDSYMDIPNLFEKVMIYLLILFDYEELKETFKYIIYMILPYLTFGLYFKKLILENEKNNNSQEEIKKQLNFEDFKKYLENNNKYVLNHFYEFIKKFCFIKLISDFKNKNEDIINSFSDLSLKTILTIIDMNDLVKILPDKDISILDIINNLPKIFIKTDILYKSFSSIINFNKVIYSLLENMKKCNDKNYIINKELILQFSPIKFNFIHLEKNIFDFIEKIAGKKCIICKKIIPKSFLCLICGEKVCRPDVEGFEYQEMMLHTNSCTSSCCIFVDTGNMKLYYINKSRILKLFSIYVDKTGAGPKGDKISNEFYLNEEKIKLAKKNYIYDDFYNKL